MLRVAFGLVAALLVCSATRADDKVKSKLAGTWVREAEGFEVKFVFPKEKDGKPDEMKIVVANGGNGMTAKVKFSLDKDGVVKGTVTEVEEKGDFPSKPPKGFEFSFKFTVDGKKAKLDEFKAENAEGAKPIIEGDYELKKDD
jgi:hypothetical protein